METAGLPQRAGRPFILTAIAPDTTDSNLLVEFVRSSAADTVALCREINLRFEIMRSHSGHTSEPQFRWNERTSVPLNIDL